MDGNPTEMGEMKIEPFYEWLWQQGPTELIVMEDYLIRPPASGGFQHEWGRVPTIQVIGAVKFWAHNHGIPVVMQMSTILTPASARTGLPYPKKGVPQRNAMSAILHGKWWWLQEGAKIGNVPQAGS